MATSISKWQSVRPDTSLKFDDRYESLLSSNGLSIPWIGRVCFESGIEIQPHVHCCYEFSIITDGIVECSVENNISRLHSGDAFITKPGEIHFLRGIGNTGWEKMYIGFDTIYPHDVAEVFRATNVTYLRGCSDTINDLHRILDEARHPKTHMQQMINSLATAWLIEISRRLHPIDKSTTVTHISEAVYKARGYIETHACHRLLVSEIAGHVSLCESHLAHIFSQEMHIPIYRFIRKTVMERALRLLEDGSLEINEISDLLGFPSPSYFSTAFKKYFGSSPINYNQPR